MNKTPAANYRQFNQYYNEIIAYYKAKCTDNNSLYLSI